VAALDFTRRPRKRFSLASIIQSALRSRQQTGNRRRVFVFMGFILAAFASYAFTFDKPASFQYTIAGVVVGLGLITMITDIMVARSMRRRRMSKSAVRGGATGPKAEGGRMWVHAEALRLSGQLDESRKVHEEALVLLKKGEDLRGQGMVMQSIGEIERMREKWDACKGALQKARDFFKEAKESRDEGEATLSLAEIDSLQGNYSGARSAYEAARPLFADVGDRLGEATPCSAGPR
jgi:hypothetical protein